MFRIIYTLQVQCVHECVWAGYNVSAGGWTYSDMTDYLQSATTEQKALRGYLRLDLIWNAPSDVVYQNSWIPEHNQKYPNSDSTFPEL